MTEVHEVIRRDCILLGISRGGKKALGSTERLSWRGAERALAMIKRALGLFAGGEGAAEEDDDSDDVTPAQRQKLERTAPRVVLMTLIDEHR